MISWHFIFLNSCIFHHFFSAHKLIYQCKHYLKYNELFNYLYSYLYSYSYSYSYLHLHIKMNNCLHYCIIELISYVSDKIFLIISSVNKPDFKKISQLICNKNNKNNQKNIYLINFPIYFIRIKTFFFLI